MTVVQGYFMIAILWACAELAVMLGDQESSLYKQVRQYATRFGTPGVFAILIVYFGLFWPGHMVMWTFRLIPPRKYRAWAARLRAKAEELDQRSRDKK